MEQIIYRKSNEGDMRQISDLLRTLDLNMADMFADGFIVAVQGARVLGCARIIEMGDGNIELASVAVVEDFRKQGIGSSMVRTILKQEKKRPVYLMCRRTNRKFYEGQGFKEICDDLLPVLYRGKVQSRRCKTSCLDTDGIAMIKES